MYRDNARGKSFGRRAALIAGGQIALFGVLAARMYQLQVLDAPRYKLLAEENRIHLRLLPPPRGRILDRYGEKLAVNRDDYRVLLVPEETPDVAATLDALAKVTDIPEPVRRRVLREVRRNRGFVPVTVRENLSWDEVARDRGERARPAGPVHRRRPDPRISRRAGRRARHRLCRGRVGEGAAGLERSRC